MRTAYQPRNERRILFVFPGYAPSFGTFEHAYALMPRVEALLPPQGLLLIAAYLPESWPIRFFDENLEAPTAADYAWADVVLTSGMHVQREAIDRIVATAHRHGKVAAVGGPSVSGCPEYYPTADYLHIGELGDATDRLIEHLDRSTARPAATISLTTDARVPLSDFPIPAYHLVDIDRYFIGSVQFSSGCPFRCEFCDIPELYGRNPRLKSPEQVVAELDALLAAGPPRAVYFVDDNFIANRKATAEMLPHLVEWQIARGYPVVFACEATIDLAGETRTLELMREAGFTSIFCGIETPESEALEAMKKGQNLRHPILGAIDTLNGYGFEVVSGIIVGLDTDTPETVDRILDFIEVSAIPMLTINLLYALPRTPLHRRLAAAGRLIEEQTRLSNVDFLLPYDEVVAMWLRTIAVAYDPARLFARFAAQIARTYAHRKKLPRRVTSGQVVFGLVTLACVLWKVGCRSDYRRWFWKAARPLVRAGRIEELIHVGLIGHHLITFARGCRAGAVEGSFYADPQRVARNDLAAARARG